MLFSIFNFFPGLYREETENYRYNERVSTYNDRWWKQFTEYYSKIDIAIAYVADIVLDLVKK